jgi:hypothetical protein
MKKLLGILVLGFSLIFLNFCDGSGYTYQPTGAQLFS